MNEWFPRIGCALNDKLSRHRPGAHVPLHPLQKGEDRVCGRKSLVGRRLGEVVADDPEGEGHALQGVDRVLVCLVVAGKNDSDSEKWFSSFKCVHGFKSMRGKETFG